jgi:hypothetical protein
MTKNTEFTPVMRPSRFNVINRWIPMLSPSVITQLAESSNVRVERINEAARSKSKLTESEFLLLEVVLHNGFRYVGDKDSDIKEIVWTLSKGKISGKKEMKDQV